MELNFPNQARSDCLAHKENIEVHKQNQIPSKVKW